MLRGFILCIVVMIVLAIAGGLVRASLDGHQRAQPAGPRGKLSGDTCQTCDGGACGGADFAGRNGE